jgi:hypothetical protein
LLGSRFLGVGKSFAELDTEVPKDDVGEFQMFAAGVSLATTRNRTPCQKNLITSHAMIVTLKEDENGMMRNGAQIVHKIYQAIVL